MPIVAKEDEVRSNDPPFPTPSGLDKSMEALTFVALPADPVICTDDPTRVTFPELPVAEVVLIPPLTDKLPRAINKSEEASPVTGVVDTVLPIEIFPPEIIGMAAEAFPPTLPSTDVAVMLPPNSSGAMKPLDGATKVMLPAVKSPKAPKEPAGRL